MLFAAGRGRIGTRERLISSVLDWIHAAIEFSWLQLHASVCAVSDGAHFFDGVSPPLETFCMPLLSSHQPTHTSAPATKSPPALCLLVPSSLAAHTASQLQPPRRQRSAARCPQKQQRRQPPRRRPKQLMPPRPMWRTWWPFCTSATSQRCVWVLCCSSTAVGCCYSCCCCSLGRQLLLASRWLPSRARPPACCCATITHTHLGTCTGACRRARHHHRPDERG